MPAGPGCCLSAGCEASEEKALKSEGEGCQLLQIIQIYIDAHSIYFYHIPRIIYPDLSSRIYRKLDGRPV
jgi:hypothetical protein